MNTATHPAHAPLRYDSLLVALSPGQDNRLALQTARTLSALFDATVTGAAACQPMQMAYGDTFGYGYGAMIQDDLTRLEQQLATAHSEFRVHMDGVTQPVQWLQQVTLSRVSDYLAPLACGADLVICTQLAAADFDATRSVDVGGLLMQAGRPVLVVPAHHSHNQEGIDQAANPFDRILICWKDSRASRRAVSDALPLLQKAQQVTLVEIAPEVDFAAAHARLDAVTAWLSRHGVAAPSSVSLSTGDDVLRLHALADEAGADLVVGGAYGHSRLREWVLGGVTRDFLLQSDRFALLSH